MTQRSGVGSYLEQDRANGEGPRAAYLALSGGVYVWSVGKKAGEAAAFLQTSGSDLVLNDDSATESRAPYLIGTSEVYI